VGDKNILESGWTPEKDFEQIRAAEEMRRREWELAHPRRAWLSTNAKRIGVVVEVALYVLLVADFLVLVAGVGKHPSYEPAGGGSIVVILLAIAVVHRLRKGGS
jgi:hypothetical protein